MINNILYHGFQAWNFVVVSNYTKGLQVDGGQICYIIK